MTNVFQSHFARNIFLQKYSMNGQEDWHDTCRRVVDAVTGQHLPNDIQEELYQAMVERKFIPGGRYLYSAGREFHQVNNCFLFRAEDSREGWADIMFKSTASLMTGGGIGVDYSLVRPEGTVIRKTGGTSTGPIALMNMVNEAGRNIMQGGQRRCLPAGSLVHTARGLVAIEAVGTEDQVLTFQGFRRVKARIKQGIQSTVVIKTQTGEFCCTPNHRVAVLKSVNGEYIWKEAKNLEEGDRLIFTAETIPGRKTELPADAYVKPALAYTAKSITIPPLDKEMAWFIGYFQANGHVHLRTTGVGKRNSSVQVSVPESAGSLKDLVQVQLDRFGVSSTQAQGDGACINVRVSSVPLALWFLDNVKQPNMELEVPSWILEGEIDIRSAYVAGLMDGDGSISSRPIQIMSCIHKDFLKQIQTVCASLGFATRLHLLREAKGNWKPLYRLLLKGSKQELQFYSTVGKCLKYKIENPRTRSKEMFSYSFTPKMVREWDGNKKELHKNYKVNFPVEVIEEAAGKKLHYTPVKVLGIEIAEEVETFDIEVDGRNEFFCNGLLVHNSAIWAGLNWSHSDTKKFIHLKDWSEDAKTLKQKDFNFPMPMEGTNISVIYDTEFFIAIEDKKHPKHKQAMEIWMDNCRQAFSTAEPGMAFNFCKDSDSLRNACTEVTSSDDSDKCNLGTVWMNRCKDKKEFGRICFIATAFLLCGGIYSHTPFEKIREVGNRNNRIGLGLGGMHEWLMARGMSYSVTPELHKWLNAYESESDSSAYVWSKNLEVAIPKGKRAIAPTGTIGIIAETTTGIEPLFCKAFKRRYLNSKQEWVHEFVVDGSVKRLLNQGIKLEHIKDSYDISFRDRVKFQADVQQYVDMAISSTCNMAQWGSPSNNEDTLESNAKTLLKYAKRLRGFTCYPDAARGGQPLTRVELEEAMKHEGVVFEEKEVECVGGVCGV